MFCRFCGKTITEDATFCNYCGKSLSVSTINSVDPIHTEMADEPEKLEEVVGGLTNKPKRKLWHKKWVWIVSSIVLVVIGIAAYGYVNMQKAFLHSNVFATNQNSPKDVSSTSGRDETKAITYKQFTFSRWGFSIDYPSDLIEIPGSWGGDGAGLKFSSSDGSVKLCVYGMNNMNNQMDNCYESSRTDGNEITYEKDVVGTGSINVFTITYPKSQSEQFDSIITHMNESFKTPNINVGG